MFDDTDGPGGHRARWSRPVAGRMLHDTAYVTCLQQSDLRQAERWVSGLAGKEKRRSCYSTASEFQSQRMSQSWGPAPCHCPTHLKSCQEGRSRCQCARRSFYKKSKERYDYKTIPSIECGGWLRDVLNFVEEYIPAKVNFTYCMLIFKKNKENKSLIILSIMWGSIDF